MIIREALSADFNDIASCVLTAFENEAEVVLIKQLHADKDVLIERVAKKGGSIVGHMMASKLTLKPGLGLFFGGVAPLSVVPTHQSNGIGSTLMNVVLVESRSLGSDALFLLGNPAYYQRFGFQVTGVGSDYPAKYFQAYELTNAPLLMGGRNKGALRERIFVALIMSAVTPSASNSLRPRPA